MTVTTTKEDIIQGQILQAAKRLFQVHGLQKVTMDDVAKAIGKGRSSLYYYYKSKDEIFDAVMDIEINAILGIITAAVDEAATVQQKLQALFLTKLRSLRDKRPFYSALDVGMDADALSDFNKTKVVHHAVIIKRETALVNRILNEGVDAGELQALKDKEKDTLIFVILSSLHGLKRELLLADNFDQLNASVEALTNMIMNGIKK